MHARPRRRLGPGALCAARARAHHRRGERRSSGRDTARAARAASGTASAPRCDRRALSRAWLVLPVCSRSSTAGKCSAVALRSPCSTGMYQAGTPGGMPLAQVTRPSPCRVPRARSWSRPFGHAEAHGLRPSRERSRPRTACARGSTGARSSSVAERAGRAARSAAAGDTQPLPPRARSAPRPPDRTSPRYRGSAALRAARGSAPRSSSSSSCECVKSSSASAEGRRLADQRAR